MASGFLEINVKLPEKLEQYSCFLSKCFGISPNYKFRLEFLNDNEFRGFVKIRLIYLGLKNINCNLQFEVEVLQENQVYKRNFEDSMWTFHKNFSVQEKSCRNFAQKT